MPYAIGGAIAFGIWALPRATKDVDVTAFVTGEALESALNALGAAGVTIDAGAARRSATERGDFVGWADAMRVDVFVPSIPFYREAEQRRRSVPFLGRPMQVLSAEDLAVFKLIFFRPKDVLDLERLLVIMRESLDVAYVRKSLVQVVGPDDQRVTTWDELVAAAAQSTS